MSSLAGLFAEPYFMLSAPSSVQAIMGRPPVVESDPDALPGIISQCYVPLHTDHH
jgi:hypothetical protein